MGVGVVGGVGVGGWVGQIAFLARRRAPASEVSPFEVWYFEELG